MTSKNLNIFLFLFIPVVFWSQQQPLHTDPHKSVDVFFKYKTTKISHSEKQLDSIYVLIDSMIRKYSMIVVTSLATSSELKKDPFIDYKRAEKIILYLREKHKLEGLIFLIQPPLRKTIYDDDNFLGKKAFVNFSPLKLRYSEKE